MKKLQVLGSGCRKCEQLMDMTRAAAEAKGQPYTLEKISDITRFADFGVMFTPALVVDGEVKVSGRMPSQEELKGMLS